MRRRQRGERAWNGSPLGMIHRSVWIRTCGVGPLPVQIDNVVRSPPYEKIFSSILTGVSPALACFSDSGGDVAVGGAHCFADLERTWVLTEIEGQTTTNQKSKE